MRSPLIQILDTIVKLDAHDARKARDIIDAHLRDLEGRPTPTMMSEQQKQIADEVVADYRYELLARQEGAELQRGLEEAVVRERERLDGPDDECPACEDEGHVGQTDAF